MAQPAHQSEFAYTFELASNLGLIAYLLMRKNANRVKQLQNFGRRHVFGSEMSLDQWEIEYFHSTEREHDQMVMMIRNRVRRSPDPD